MSRWDDGTPSRTWGGKRTVRYDSKVERIRELGCPTCTLLQHALVRSALMEPSDDPIALEYALHMAEHGVGL